ncbi:TPA: TIGR03750 family conjugal transfer protein [Escherichia coli]|nr:TIGR03750 family conjugal transfer protein [Escherichia coli]
METIRFLPDRLNAEPTVFRGFITPELGLAALSGVFLGLLWTLPLIPLFGWVIIPTGALLTPLLLVWTGGVWITRLKRGKPDNWLWQRIEEKKAALGVGRPAFIREAQGWSLRRSRVRGGKG